MDRWSDWWTKGRRHTMFWFDFVWNCFHWPNRTTKIICLKFKSLIINFLFVKLIVSMTQLCTDIVWYRLYLLNINNKIIKWLFFAFITYYRFILAASLLSQCFLTYVFVILDFVYWIMTANSLLFVCLFVLTFILDILFVFFIIFVFVVVLDALYFGLFQFLVCLFSFEVLFIVFRVACSFLCWAGSVLTPCGQNT